jgi:DNA polymerase
MLIDFFFDFETRSKLDLKKVGTVKYVTHPSSEATLITWCFGSDGEVKAWKRGEPIHPELRHVALNPDKFHFIAHNVLFDYLMWTVLMAKLIPGLKRPAIENITDNMALTNYNRISSGLDSAAAMLRLPYSKDKEGRRLMLKQCKPESTGKNKGNFYELTEEEMVHFVKYGIIDTKLLRDIYYKCKPLPPSERWGFEWTFKRNLRGVRIDLPLLGVLEEILAVEIPRLKQEFFELTGFQVGQRAKCLELFGAAYGMENMQKQTVKDILDDKSIPPSKTRKALEIKQEVGSTSLAKVDVARRMNHNGRLYDIWNFLKAGTRRWAGKGIQPQNFPRTFDIPMLDNLNIPNLAEMAFKVKHLQTDQCQMVKDLLRRLWLPDEGKYFYCGDFSKIEPTVLFWMLGMGRLSPIWYEEMAAEIYSVPVNQIKKGSEERQIGKNSALGCGYGLGWKGFTTQVKAQAGIDISKELATRAVKAYRYKHWQVVEFWSHLEVGFRTALQGSTASIAGGKITFMPMLKPLKGVQIKLPSGSFLFYPGAKQKDGKLYYETYERGGVQDEGTYGGKLCENVVSATARDIMLSSMFRLEEAGFENLGTVHDEVWSQAAEGMDELYEKAMCTIPSWCGDMHVTVESENGVRYLK